MPKPDKNQLQLIETQLEDEEDDDIDDDIDDKDDTSNPRDDHEKDTTKNIKNITWWIYRKSGRDLIFEGTHTGRINEQVIIDMGLGGGEYLCQGFKSNGQLAGKKPFHISNRLAANTNSQNANLPQIIQYIDRKNNELIKTFSQALEKITSNNIGKAEPETNSIDKFLDSMAKFNKVTGISGTQKTEIEELKQMIIAQNEEIQRLKKDKEADLKEEIAGLREEFEELIEDIQESQNQQPSGENPIGAIIPLLLNKFLGGNGVSGLTEAQPQPETQNQQPQPEQKQTPHPDEQKRQQIWRKVCDLVKRFDALSQEEANKQQTAFLNDFILATEQRPEPWINSILKNQNLTPENSNTRKLILSLQQQVKKNGQ